MDFNNGEPLQHYQHTNEFDGDLNHQHLHENGNYGSPNQKALEMEVSSERKPHEHEPLYQKHGFLHRHAEQVQVIPEGTAIPPMRYRNNNVMDHNQNRGERSQLMRAYEQRQAQRQAHYASMERENETEQRLRQSDQNINNYNEYGRSGRRSGILEPVRFTHYVNYNELQSHLSSRKETLSDSQIVQMRLQVQQQRLKVEEESRKQHQYHSQRHVRHDNQLRPVSNFYEYESVQSILNTHGRTNAAGYPTQQPPNYKETIPNSHIRQQSQNRHGIAARNHSNQYQQQQHRGPFVTHVTIGEHQPQPNGSRVYFISDHNK